MPASVDDPEIVGALARPFREQVRFFQDKMQTLISTEKWTDVWKDAHDRAFMVAGAQKADLLADFARVIEEAIEQGESIDWFRKQFDRIVEEHGWSYRGEYNWRTRVIYRTNSATSYAAGQLAQLVEEGFRYWVYQHSDDVLEPRPLHLAWHGLVLPADHEWWATHYPPNGWGCECYVVGVDDLEDADLVGGDPAKELDPAWLQVGPNGEPVGIDRGWGYQPGRTSDLVRLMREKVGKLPPQLGAEFRRDLDDRPSPPEMPGK